MTSVRLSTVPEVNFLKITRVNVAAVEVRMGQQGEPAIERSSLRRRFRESHGHHGGEERDHRAGFEHEVKPATALIAGEDGLVGVGHVADRVHRCGHADEPDGQGHAAVASDADDAEAAQQRDVQHGVGEADEVW